MRLFYALTFNEKEKDDLLQVQKQLIAESAGGNFTRRENLHLTLKFMGEIRKQEYPVLKQALQESVAGLSPFSVSFSHIITFGNGQKKLVAMALKESKPLQNLYRCLEINLERQGFPKEKKAFPKEKKAFRPHITLGREVLLKKGQTGFKKVQMLEDTSLYLNKISIMESKRVNNLLTYTVLDAALFNKTENYS